MTTDTSPPRGMRDFYPREFRVRELLFDAWRAAADLHGFEFVDAPVVESFELFERKAGEEISEQVYAFEDKSGRRLALRPEFTPSLARLLLARRDLASAPQKWTAIAQCFRYERMSRGRKREHYQWNLDVINASSVIAEVEVIGSAVDAMRHLGITASDVAVHIGSRRLLAELYRALDLPPERFIAWCRVVDKQDRVGRDELRSMLAATGFTNHLIDRTMKILDIDSLSGARAVVGASVAIQELEIFFSLASVAELSDFLIFDLGIVRGLDYYSGIVFEAFDRDRQFRAIFGGGRYENLLENLGGPNVSCVGLGFGDVVILELLQSLGRLSAAPRLLDVCVGYMTDEALPLAVATTVSLRTSQCSVELGTKAERAKSFFGRASKANARYAILVGPDEVASGDVVAKNLETGEVVPADAIFREHEHTG